MLKNVLKVFYIGVVVILALFVYIMGYNTNTADHIKKITNEAIQERDYTEVARIHGGCFDEVNIVEAQPSINTNNYELAVFKSASLFTTSYLNDEEQMLEYNVFDYSYYIYFFGYNDTMDASTDGTNFINKSAIKFVGDNGEYTYYLKVSNVYNNSDYNKKPTNINEAVLGQERDLLTNNWGFINITFTETLFEAMNIGNIKEIEFMNSTGETIYATDVVLDFNKGSGFFKDVTELVVEYNDYIDNVFEIKANEELSNSERNDKLDEINTDFQEYLKAFDAKFLAEPTTYSYRHPDEYLKPSSVTWKTIGLLAIYAVAVAVLYLLLFNFAWIKRLLTRNSYTTDYGTRAVNKNRQNSIDAKVKEVKKEPTNTEEKSE